MEDYKVGTHPRRLVCNPLVIVPIRKSAMEAVTRAMRIFCTKTFVCLMTGLLSLQAAESTVLKSDRQIKAARESEQSTIKTFRARLDRINGEVKAYRELEIQQLPAFDSTNSDNQQRFSGSGIPTAMGTGAMAGAAAGAAINPGNPGAGAGMGVAVGGLGGLVIALIAQEIRNSEMRKIGEENKRRIEAERKSMRLDIESKVQDFRMKRLSLYRAELQEEAAAHLMRIQEVP